MSVSQVHWLICILPLVFAGPGPVSQPVFRSYSSSYYYSDYTFSKNPHKHSFLPGPQYCPDTGRTVCKKVFHYPHNEAIEAVSGTKTPKFNFSSVFVDERDGDAEPDPTQLPDRPPGHYKQDGYIVYQTSVHYDYQVPNTRRWGYQHPFVPPIAPYHRRRGIVKRNEDEQQACPVRTMFISPRAGLNDKSQWKFIINVADRDPKFKQIIRVDVCAAPGEPCSSQVSLPLGYVSRCRQKYIKKKLLALDADGQGTSEENFFVPSCCVCNLVRETDAK